MVVQTHRDPLEVVPSFHKLCTTMHATLTPAIDIPRTVQAHTDWLSWQVERNTKARAALPQDKVLDIEYRTLLQDPIAVVERIHDRFSLPLTGADIDRMRAYLQAHSQRAHGPNPYSAQAFGQRTEAIAERFASYREAHGYEGVKA